MNPKTYLVTGGTGFIGSALVRRLIEDGHRVRVLDNDSRGLKSRLIDIAGAVDLTPGDVRDAESVRQAVQDVDCVCHLAYVNGTEYFYSKPNLVLEIAVKGMINLLDECSACGVREFILASSSEVYQTPPIIPTPEDVPLSVPDILNPRYSYGGGKIISELLLLHYARDFFDRVVIFRPHNAYGPDVGSEHVIPQFIHRMIALAAEYPETTQSIDFPIQGTGNETRAFLYISDLIDGVMRVIAAGENRGVYHIGTDLETSIADLANRVAGAFNRKIRVVPGKLLPGGPARRCPDISRLRALGYEPRVSLAQGLAKTVEWYRSQIRDEFAAAHSARTLA